MNLDKAEIKQFFVNFFKEFRITIDLNDAWIDEVFDRIDVNKDGSINIEEFQLL